MNIRGERIKCVSNLHAPELIVGKVYTAGESHTNTHGIWQVDVDGKWYAQVLFELTKEEEMKQQFYVDDVVEVVETKAENWYKVGDKFVVSGWNDGKDALSSDPPHVTVDGEDKYAWVLAKDLKILSRAWQKNTGKQPVDNDVYVEVEGVHGHLLTVAACEVDWYLFGGESDVHRWRIADSVSSTESQPEDSVPPSHVAVGEELVATTTLPVQEWTDKHYENNYTLTQKDIERGYVKIDPYFVSKVWKIGSRDDSGALWHCFKTIARFGEKNSREREIKALYAQIKRLADIEGVELE